MSQKDRYISKVLGIKLDITRKKEVLKKVESWLMANRGKRYIVTPNPEMVMLGQSDEEFKRALNGADIAIPDGIGLRLADKRLKRVTGVEVMEGLVRLSAKKAWRVMLVGGKRGMAVKAAEGLRQRYGNLRIEAEAGPQQMEKATAAEKRKLVEKINQFKPELLFVGLGHGKQEKWIARNLAKLEVKVAMGVGGAIDYMVKPWLQAPKILRLMGLEWWWRLMLQPWRIKRQLALVKFMWLVVRKR